ncbi:MAG: hypothetical protein ACFFBD_14110 [Candidatus Hodarchaeota archaeon]
MSVLSDLNPFMIEVQNLNTLFGKNKLVKDVSFQIKKEALDPRAVRNVKDLIKVLSGSQKTVFLCSHWMSLAETLCDRVAIIHKGQLLTLGTPDQIKEWTNTENLEEAFLSVIPAEEQKDFKQLYLEDAE